MKKGGEVEEMVKKGGEVVEREIAKDVVWTSSAMPRAISALLQKSYVDVQAIATCTTHCTVFRLCIGSS